jgi:hypothetical protein
MSTFRTGDIVTIHSMTGPLARFNGTACEILRPIKASIAKHVDTGKPMYVEGHRAMTIEGDEFIIPVEHLSHDRAARREIDAVVAWSECAWMPREMRT